VSTTLVLSYTDAKANISPCLKDCNVSETGFECQSLRSYVNAKSLPVLRNLRHKFTLMELCFFLRSFLSSQN